MDDYIAVLLGACTVAGDAKTYEVRQGFRPNFVFRQRYFIGQVELLKGDFIPNASCDIRATVIFSEDVVPFVQAGEPFELRDGPQRMIAKGHIRSVERVQKSEDSRAGGV